MKTTDKKLSMADKMYKQNSTGGVGSSPKNYQNGKETKSNSRGQKFDMVGKDTGYAKGQRYSQSDKTGKFGADKYNQADPSGSMKGGYKQASC